MRKLMRNTLTAGAAMAAVVGITALPAHADVTWSVSGGTSITGTNVGTLTAKDVTTGAAVTCTQATATGTALNGTGLPGNGLATLTGATFATPGNPNNWCSGPAGIVIRITADNLPNWKFNAVTPTATGATGTLTGVKATIHGSDECDATITGPGGGAGTINGSYTNSSGELAVSGGNLEVATADDDCDPTLINATDKVTLNGKYKINPILTITSP
ncbi:MULTISPECIES: hypothetical protein [Actinomadura]|uniref:Secreted protein n=1 Tax=Actinomadura yumaensis TaxID=111807 RepID=A0ABW2CLN1_9ACTN|nr:hypothetical protein [Actinomadura sp. J1-007]MWK36502.1 hypothetical protein [Actinomadura sp. J1-007]